MGTWRKFEASVAYSALSPSLKRTSPSTASRSRRSRRSTSTSNVTLAPEGVRVSTFISQRVSESWTR